MSGSGGSSLVNRHRLSLFHVTQSDSFFVSNVRYWYITDEALKGCLERGADVEGYKKTT